MAKILAASLAALRTLLALGPECRSSSLRNHWSPSPEAKGVERRCPWLITAASGVQPVFGVDRFGRGESTNVRRRTTLAADNGIQGLAAAGLELHRIRSFELIAITQ
jgi:hypothetical protein